MKHFVQLLKSKKSPIEENLLIYLCLKDLFKKTLFFSMIPKFQMIFFTQVFLTNKICMHDKFT